MCTTLAQHRLEWQRRACTATAFLPVSKYFSDYLPVFCSGHIPVFPDRAPSIAKAFFIRIPIL